MRLIQSRHCDKDITYREQTYERRTKNDTLNNKWYPSISYTYHVSVKASTSNSCTLTLSSSSLSHGLSFSEEDVCNVEIYVEVEDDIKGC